MPYHRVTIRSQGASHALELDGKPIVAKHVIIEMQAGRSPQVTFVVEASSLEFDSVLSELPTKVVLPPVPVVPIAPNEQEIPTND
jgi:hypothetical protein